MTTWQDLKVVIQDMTEKQLSQPVHLFVEFDSSWHEISDLDELDKGDIRQISRERLGATKSLIVGTPYFVVED